jgi:hypothetical protein
MIAPFSAHWLIRLAVVLALPAIPCFAYYSLAYVDDAHGALKLLVVLAGPLALIGASGLIWGLLKPRRSKLMLWLAGVTLVLPVLLLLWIRA